MSCDLHPLHSPRWIAEYVLKTGKYPGPRMTGRTTAAILVAIGRALQTPGVCVVVQEHLDYNPTETAFRRISEQCRRLIDQIGLSHFYVWYTPDSAFVQFGGECDVIRNRRR